MSLRTRDLTSVDRTSVYFDPGFWKRHRLDTDECYLFSTLIEFKGSWYNNLSPAQMELVVIKPSMELTRHAIDGYELQVLELVQQDHISNLPQTCLALAL